MEKIIQIKIHCSNNSLFILYPWTPQRTCVATTMGVRDEFSAVPFYLRRECECDWDGIYATYDVWDDFWVEVFGLRTLKKKDEMRKYISGLGPIMS